MESTESTSLLHIASHKHALRQLCVSRFMSLRVAMLVGGDSMEAQFAELASNPDVIVATPGAAQGLACHAASSGHIVCAAADTPQTCC